LIIRQILSPGTRVGVFTAIPGTSAIAPTIFADLTSYDTMQKCIAPAFIVTVIDRGLTHCREDTTGRGSRTTVPYYAVTKRIDKRERSIANIYPQVA